MADTIRLELVTPDRRLVSAEVSEVVAQGALGQFGVLPGHANYITLLDPGEFNYLEQGQRKYVAVLGGFAEVSLEGGIKILAEAAEFADEIDQERAQAARQRAERRIADFDPANQEIDVVRAEASLKRALIRIRVSEFAGD